MDYRDIGPYHHLAFPLIRTFIEEVLAPKSGAYPPELTVRIYSDDKLRGMRDRYARSIYDRWLEKAIAYAESKGVDYVDTSTDRDRRREDR
jgi:hypothetical protein